MRRAGLICAVLVVLAAPAYANEQTRAGGAIGTDGLDAWIESTGPGGSGGGGGGPADSWVEITYKQVHGGSCLDGISRIATRHFRDGSPSVVVNVSCPRAPLPPGLAAVPPSQQQVRDAVDLPTSEAGINPHVRGLVGLETWFWYDGPDAATVQVGLNGGTVTAEATVVAYEFATGDGAVYTSEVPGTEDSPAARHVYQRHGTYDVTVTVIWQGTFTFTAPGGATVAGDLGTMRTSSTRAYDVVESQAVRSR